FEPKPGWHGYWENPGDAGLGLQLEWQLPMGVTAGKPRFPVPKPLLIGGLMNHVYEEPHAVLVDLDISPTVRVGTVLPVKVKGNWLACTDRICVPQSGAFDLELRAGDGRIDAADRARFDAWRAALPVPLDQPGRFAVKGTRYGIAIPFPASAALDRPWFFAANNDSIRHAAPQSARRVGNWLVIETEALPGAGPVHGLLRFGEGQGLLVRTAPGNIPQGGNAVAPLIADDKSIAASDGLPLLPLPLLLLAALAGGLFLNLMPCVFPILGLKALALAKAGGNEPEARRDALAYSAGVILSCLALGSLLLGLRAGGEEVGWAFQLQEPAFVLFLLLLMVAVAANLAGLFELRGFGGGDALTRRAGVSGSFWTGVLAAIVATPCTGPFMAAALGAALLLPAAEALLLFAALGLGIALPFLAIAYIPRLRAILPRPGPWLNGFRRAMAVPMALTALALGWLLWRQAGGAGLWIAITSAAGLLLVLWFYRSNADRMRYAGPALLAAIALLYIGAVRWLPGEAERAAGPTELHGQPFDGERLAALRAQGKPVFLYFTADWCVTCKVNEAAAIDRAETERLFRKKGITLMVGDFTRRDPAIARFLGEHGRSGVPLYLFYPAQGKVRELPQLLTVGVIADAVND
ncbi:MAG: protein-disulfide reductase DsbD family protein, partial [Sphingorhabdus sp.]